MRIEEGIIVEICHIVEPEHASVIRIARNPCPIYSVIRRCISDLGAVFGIVSRIPHFIDTVIEYY